MPDTASEAEIPSPSRLAAGLRAVFSKLLDRYGPQDWWPGENRFEILVGAVLTQNTSWAAVERALDNLRAAGALDDPKSILIASPARLAGWLRPSGYFRIKAKRLRNLLSWFLAQGGFRRLSRFPTARLRAGLLGISGVGPETADDILLYAFERPVFVVDAYTRRLFARLGWIGGEEPYEDLRSRLEGGLAPDPAFLNEYHALIVRHCKEVCRKKPRCGKCLLASGCRFAAREGINRGG